MSFEDRLRESIEARAEGMRAQLETHLLELTAEVMKAAEEERTELERQAAESTAAEIERVRADAERQVETAVARAAEEADARLAVELSRLQAEQEQTLAGDRARAAAETDQRLADAEQRVTDARGQERQAQVAATERLLQGVRRLDRGRSLTDVLSMLADAAAAETPRVAVLVVNGPRLAGWRAAGFPGAAESLNLPLADAGIVSDAVSRHESCFTRRGEAAAPSFAALPPDRAGIAVPIAVGGQVGAVVYADDVSDREPQTPASWPETIEILARHAAACLETLTARRTAEALGLPAAAAGGSGARHAAAGADDEHGARRYAKLLVSEIKL
jgi:hypothetical protein